MASRGAGFTLVELLVVLTLLGCAVAATVAVGRPSGAHRAASAVRALLVWGHLRALRSGSDTAVGVTSRGLVVRPADGAARACGGGTTLRLLRWSDFGGVRLERALRSPILWRADGIALSCAGGGVISDRMVLADGRSRYAVVVSSLGRVRVERLP